MILVNFWSTNCITSINLGKHYIYTSQAYLPDISVLIIEGSRLEVTISIEIKKILNLSCNNSFNQKVMRLYTCMHLMNKQLFIWKKPYCVFIGQIIQIVKMIT